MKLKCVVCGNEFDAVKSTASCCSNPCRQKKWKMSKGYLKDREPRNCVICGKEFIPINKNHICCSQECSRLRNIQVNKATEKERYANHVHLMKIQTDMPPSNHDAIAQLTIEAGGQGLSYGQLEAKRWSEKNGFRLRKM